MRRRRRKAEGHPAWATDVDDPDLLVRMTKALSQSWSRDTSAEPQAWSEATPARGQCAVTALVVQDLLGGELLRCDVGNTSHYWNRLPSKREIDLTRHQFGPDFEPRTIEERSRDYVLAFSDTRNRYGKLRKRVEARLRAEGERSSSMDCEAVERPEID
jgi:hypothetical protein